MDSWISIAGSVASVGGAGWAFYEARASAHHALKAETIRDELIGRREMVEISRIHVETNRILRIVSPVGPTCTKSGVRGIKGDTIAKEVEEYSRFLNEHSSHFTQFFDNRAKELCNSLKEHIEALAEAETFESKKEAGKQIYYLINSFMPEVKCLSDEKKEDVDVG